MGRKKKIKSIQVVGRRWFQKSYGNTYNTVKISVNQGDWIILEEEYGYGDYYIQRAHDYLIKNKIIDCDQMTPLYRYCDDNKIIFMTSVQDVPREKDLAF